MRATDAVTSTSGSGTEAWLASVLSVLRQDVKLLQRQVLALQEDNGKQKLENSEQAKRIAEQNVRIEELLERLEQQPPVTNNMAQQGVWLRQQMAAEEPEHLDWRLNSDLVPVADETEKGAAHVNGGNGGNTVKGGDESARASYPAAELRRTHTSYGVKAAKDEDRGPKKFSVTHTLANIAVKIADWVDRVDVALDDGTEAVQTTIAKGWSNSGLETVLPASLRSSITSLTMSNEPEPPEEVTLEESMWGVVLLIGTDAMGEAT